MNSKTIAIKEGISSYEEIEKKLEKTLQSYEITTPINQWIINLKGEKCIIVKKSFWNSVCIELKEKKGELEIFSVISHPQIDTVFRRQFGLIGVLILESSWKKLRNEVFEKLS